MIPTLREREQTDRQAERERERENEGEREREKERDRSEQIVKGIVRHSKQAKNSNSGFVASS